MECILEVSKSVSVTNAIVSDIITYKLEVKNIWNKTVEEVIVKDLIPEELKFIIGSVKVDYKPDTYSNIMSGVNLGPIEPNVVKIITFDVKIIKKLKEDIENKSLIEFRYTEDGQSQWDSIYSNETKVIINNPKINIFQQVDRENVQLDDEVTYQIIISNVGDLDIENIALINDISESVTLIDGTFMIGNVIVNSVELNKGITLNNLKIGDSVNIRYTVKIESGGCLGKICNKIKAKYSYKLTNGVTNYKNSEESLLCIDVAISSFKQINIDAYLNILDKEPDISEINDIKGTIDIEKYNVIKTPVAKSSEGKKLSGYKLLVHGKINHIVEYISCETIQSIHSSYYSIPFSTYIVLPKDFKQGNKICVEGIVEDIYFDIIDKRCFFKSTTMMLIAKISSFK